MNSASKNLGRNRKNPPICCCKTGMPRNPTPARTMPIQVSQKTSWHSSSLGDGKAAVFSNWAAPAFSDSRSNFTKRKKLRSKVRSRYATTHPKSAMIRIANKRGSKWAKARANSSHAWPNSLAIMSAIMNLFLVPSTAQSGTALSVRTLHRGFRCLPPGLPGKRSGSRSEMCMPCLDKAAPGPE